MSYFNPGQLDLEELAKLYGGIPAPTNTRPPAVMPVSKPADLGFDTSSLLQNLNMQDILPPLRKPDAPIASIQPPAKTRAQIAAEYTAQAPERLREQESLQAAMATHLAETQPVTEPTLQTNDALTKAMSGMFNIPTTEELAGLVEQAKTTAAKAAAAKVEATAQAAKDKEVYDYLANPGPPPTGTETIDRFIAGIGPASLITLDEIQANPAYANMSLSQQKALVDSSNANNINTKQSAAAQEAKDFWATQDYDPNKYKVAPDASFGEKITGLARVSDSVFQSIARGNVPKGAIGQYAGMAQLGDNPMPSLAEMLNGVNVNVGGRSGGSLAGSSPITQYMAQSSIPPYLKIPGSSSSAAAGLVGHDDVNRVYMNTGEDLSKKYRNMAGKGKWIIPEGGGTIGAYDIQFVNDAYDPRAGGSGFFNDYLMPVATAVMTYFNPIMGVAMAGTKAAAGETLHLKDYASALMGGLKASKILEAPTKAVAATATTPAIAADAGSGLFNNALTYDQSVKALNTAFAAADGDIVGGVVSQFGDVLTEKALGGKDGDFLTGLKADYNINSDDLIKGLVKSEKALLAGAPLQEAVLQGVGKYITEGGSLGTGGNFKTPEILKKLEDVVRTVGSQIDDTILQPIKETLPVIVNAAEKIGKPIEKGLRAVNDAVVKPVVETAIDAGSAVNREVVKPVVGAVEEVGKPIERGIRAVNEAVIEPVVDTAIEAGSAVNRGLVKPVVDFLRGINLPNLPNPNAPRSGQYNPNQELAYLQQFMNRPSTTQPAIIPEVTEGDPYAAFDWETIFRTKEQADEYASALGVDVDADPDSVALQELSLDFARGGVVRGNDLDQLIQILEGNR